MNPIQRIFITIPWFTPAYKAGGPILSILNLINHPQVGVEYFVFTSVRDLDGEKLKDIQANNWYQFNEHTKVFYSKRVGRADVLMAQVKIVQPNVIYAIGVFDWHFNITPLFFCRADKKILSVRGMLHTAALQQKSLKKNIFLAFIKMMGIRQLSEFHATDEVEVSYIKEVFGNRAKVHIADNYPRLFASKTVTEKKQGYLKLVSICLISKMKNILLVLESLQFSKSEVEYNIYGIIKDEDYWASCLEAIKLLPTHVQVKFHGALLPSQVEAVLQDNEIFIQPSESENYGHAIVEALSAGLPVIISDNTPWKNLKGEKAGLNVDLHTAAIANAIDYFAAMNQKEYNEWSIASEMYINNAIDLKEIDIQYQKMFFSND